MTRELVIVRAYRVRAQLVSQGSGNVCGVNDRKFPDFERAVHRLTAGIGLVEAGVEGGNRKLVDRGRARLRRVLPTLQEDFGLK